jgi:hypothetical protein
MERTYRASNALYVYLALLALATLALSVEAVQRFQNGDSVAAALLGVLAAVWLVILLWLYARWGRLRVVVRPDSLLVAGGGPTRRIRWSDVEQVREIRGPAYQLSLKGWLPGPYLPHGLLQGETVLELVTHSAMSLVLRRALVHGYGTLQQDVVRLVPKDADVDLHARWWHD